MNAEPYACPIDGLEQIYRKAIASDGMERDSHWFLAAQEPFVRVYRLTDPTENASPQRPKLGQ